MVSAAEIKAEHGFGVFVIFVYAKGDYLFKVQFHYKPTKGACEILIRLFQRKLLCSLQVKYTIIYWVTA